jgi:hypothetical protein
MPYANYDDVNSICAVYNHCLKEDADMDFFEFIGEKMLAFGFAAEEEEKESSPAQPQHPINRNAVVQIQSGALYRQPVEEIKIDLPLKQRERIPTSNTGFIPQEYHPGIFHPPAA